jgi:hypothetical protein
MEEEEEEEVPMGEGGSPQLRGEMVSLLFCSVVYSLSSRRKRRWGRRRRKYWFMKNAFIQRIIGDPPYACTLH